MLVFLASSFLAASAMAQAASADPCLFDREQMLALGQQAFDQDMDGGWRKVSRRRGCLLAAADLIRAYRERHRLEAAILYWHEGQLRAQGGETEAAIRLFEKSRQDGPDPFGWNHYVDASVAFLRGDRLRLLFARDALACLPRPTNFAPRDPQGRLLQAAWPPNLNVVDGLIACFGKSYSEAYGSSCTRPAVVLKLPDR